jgi:hypothetical protein
MVLGDVEETVTTVDIDDETYDETIKVRCVPLPPGCERARHCLTRSLPHTRPLRRPSGQWRCSTCAGMASFWCRRQFGHESF